MLIGTCKFFEEKHRFFQGVFAFVFNESEALPHQNHLFFLNLFFPGHISNMKSPNSV